jgi:hypothetical protein
MAEQTGFELSVHFRNFLTSNASDFQRPALNSSFSGEAGLV